MTSLARMLDLTGASLSDVLIGPSSGPKKTSPPKTRPSDPGSPTGFSGARPWVVSGFAITDALVDIDLVAALGP